MEEQHGQQQPLATVSQRYVANLKRTEDGVMHLTLGRPYQPGERSVSARERGVIAPGSVRAMNNATRGARAVGLALALLVAAPSAAQAGWSHRMHWRGLHSSWLTHNGAGAARAVPTGEGPVGVTFDDATRTVYVANVASNTVSVVDGARCNADRASGCDAPVATLPTGLAPVSAAVDARTLYVSNVDAGTVSVFDVATCNAFVSSGCGAAVATVDVGGFPLGIAVDPASHTVYVGNDATGSLALINGTTCNRMTTTGCAVVAQAITGEFSGSRSPTRLAHDLRGYRTGPRCLGGGQRARLQRRRDGRLRAPRRHRGRRPRRRHRRVRFLDAHGLRRQRG